MKKNQKIKGFWGGVLIFVVGAVAGGIIYSFAYNGILEDEINSVNFIKHRDQSLTNKINNVKTPVYSESMK